MSLRRFRMTLAYDGTDFHGWQRLGGKARTVQGTVEAALSRVLGSATEVDGAGRTDAGVHAEGQVASFSAETGRPPASLMADLQALLPADIACLSLDDAEPRFHARYLAKGKVYRYRILNHPLSDPFLRRWSLHVSEPLDLEAMRRAAAPLLGRHNFQAFTNLKEKGKSFERRLDAVEVSRAGKVVDILFRGEGFLHNQARIMAGALIHAGQGRLDAAGMKAVLESRDRSRAPGAAGAFGLCLVEVLY